MLPITKFKITKKKISNNKYSFTFEPLPQGFAYTLGNTLRRILYSSIPGTAVTSIRINGASHEYSTIKGISDDVLTIMLKVKQLALKSSTDEVVTLKLSKKATKDGEVITAADFEKNSLVEIVNPELEITTVAKGTTVDIEINVERGIGYALPDESKRREVGVIPVDAIFNPVKLVTLHTDNARVGQQTDLDKLTLEITTDGSMDPDAALFKATDIFNDMAVHLKEQSSNIVDGDLPTKYAVEKDDSDYEPEQEPQVQKAPVLVSSMSLSTRLTNALVNSNIHDLNQLDGKVEEDVKSIKGMGDKSFNELKAILAEYDISLI
jgi:DNA-directed RNA polymerase subunit alpha